MLSINVTQSIDPEFMNAQTIMFSVGATPAIDLLHQSAYQQPPRCTHVAAVTIAHLRNLHMSYFASTTDSNDLTTPQRLHFQYLSIMLHGWSVYARLVDYRTWAVMQYSTDGKKFHCFLCNSSARCHHFKSIKGNAADTSTSASALRLTGDTAFLDALLTNADGTLRASSLSQTPVRADKLSQEQMTAMADREQWLLKEFGPECNIWSANKSTDPIIELMSDEPICNCKDRNLVNIENDAILLLPRQFLHVRCISLRCSNCFVIAQYANQ
jgi:hypothetical protein